MTNAGKGEECVKLRESEVKSEGEAKKVRRNYKKRHTVFSFFLLSHTQRPILVSLFYHSPFGWKKTRTTLMSGSTVHDLSLADPL